MFEYSRITSIAVALVYCIKVVITSDRLHSFYSYCAKLDSLIPCGGGGDRTEEEGKWEDAAQFATLARMCAFALTLQRMMGMGLTHCVD